MRHEPPAPSTYKKNALTDDGAAGAQALQNFNELNRKQLSIPVDLINRLAGGERPWRLGPLADYVSFCKSMDAFARELGARDDVAGQEVPPSIRAAGRAHQRFEADGGCHTVSRVGFSDDGNLAIMEYSQDLASFGGGGALYVLARRPSGWEIIQVIGLWES